MANLPTYALPMFIHMCVRARVWHKVCQKVGLGWPMLISIIESLAWARPTCNVRLDRHKGWPDTTAPLIAAKSEAEIIREICLLAGWEHFAAEIISAGKDPTEVVGMLLSVVRSPRAQ
jgi:hypothetical protein